MLKKVVRNHLFKVVRNHGCYVLSMYRALKGVSYFAVIAHVPRWLSPVHAGPLIPLLALTR